MSEQNQLDLYNRTRPKLWKEVVGQREAVKTLYDALKANALPHALLLVGNSGCGKTTCARILKDKLECGDGDFIEINAAESRGIDTVREIGSQVLPYPMYGKTRIFLVDEVARWTVDAQSAALKILEDVPPHVYFILCTTDPQKLLRTIRTRCMVVEFKPLSVTDLCAVVKQVLLKIDKTLTDPVILKIAECSEGSARQAVVTLQSVLLKPTEEEQLAEIHQPRVEKQAFDIVKALLWEKTSWPDMQKLLETVDEDPEKVRRMVMSQVKKGLLKSTGRQAARLMAIGNRFYDPYYDCGDTKLVMACYQLLGEK